MNLDNKSFRVNFSTTETENLRNSLPLICIFIFGVSSFFFINMLIRSILPLGRDIKERRKKLLYYYPVKYRAPSSGRLFLSLPLAGEGELEVNRDVFNAIGEKDECCLEIAPRSGHIFRLTKNDKTISFNEEA